MPVPEENPWTPAKAALGERLFSETRLSITGDYSCASCHDPQRYFTDGRVVAVGATGMAHSRNTPSLYNAAYNVSYGWTDLGLSSLEMQHRVPMFNEHPVELGYSESLLADFDGAKDIRRMATNAFGEPGLSTRKIVGALASFVRTLRHPEQPFDRLLFFDDRT